MTIVLICIYVLVILNPCGILKFETAGLYSISYLQLHLHSICAMDTIIKIDDHQSEIKIDCTNN